MQLVFESSWLKIQRAREHLQEFQVEMSKFSKSEFCELQINPLDDGTAEISLTVTKDFPKDISLIIGDVFHNLRSSLDHLYAEILIKYGLPIDHNQFPVTDNDSKLETNKSILALGKCCPKAKELLTNIIKPYKSGNYNLWALNKLNNIDKHRLLLTVAQGTAAGLEGRYLDGSQFGVGFSNIRDVINQPNIVKVCKHVSQITKFNLPSIQVFLGKNGYFDDHPVEHVINLILQEVQTTITQFQSIEY